MPDKEYWETLDVNYENILEDWPKHKKALRNFLKKFDEVDLYDVCEILNIHQGTEVTTDRKQAYLKLILRSAEAKTLVLLRKFFQSKAEIINEHFERIISSNRVIKRHRSTFVNLLEIYISNKDELLNILIYHYWHRNVFSSFTFTPSIPFKREFIGDFEEKIKKFIVELKPSTQEKKKFKYFGKVDDGSRIIFSIIRQTSDKLIRNIDKNKRNKTASDLLICFDKIQNLLEIRCKDKKLVNRSVDVLTKVIRIYFVKKEHTIEDIDTDKLLNSLENYEPDPDFVVCGISFRKSKLRESSPVALLPPPSLTSIHRAALDLKERDLVDISPLNIQSLTIRFRDRLTEVKIRPEGNKLKFALEKAKLSDIQLSKFSNKFKEFTGIAINDLLVVAGDDVDEELLTKKILSSYALDVDGGVVQEVIDKLVDFQIIEAKSVDVFQCADCRRSNEVGAPCPHCQSHTCKQFRTYTQIKVPRAKVVNYLVSRLAGDDIKVHDKNTIRTWQRKYEFLKLKIGVNYVYVFATLKKIPTYLISFFERSALPIVIVNYGDAENDEIRLLTNFREVSLPKLISGSVSPEEFTSVIRDAVTNTNDGVVYRAANSYRQLSRPENYTHDLLEDDTFNILKYVFRNVEKWGKERKGQEIPEGLGEISFVTGVGINKRTFSWDCKYTYGDTRNLDIDEKRKIETYIRNLNKTKEVKDASTQLSAFIVVSNKLDTDSFTTFAEYVQQKVRSWKGNLVLIETDELLYLYSKVNRNYEQVMRAYDLFNQNLANLFCTRRQRVFKVTKEMVDQLFQSPSLVVSESNR